MGTAVSRVKNWPEYNESLIKRGRVNKAPAARLGHANLTGRMAILAGVEHDGISADCLNRPDTKLKIPMADQADSLNVNVAIVLFEALRQRG